MVLKQINSAMSKSDLLAEMAENAGITKKQATEVLDQIGLLIEGHLGNRKVGKFVLPGLLKIEVKRKPATKARKGINPFNGEETIFKAKPARNVVKIRPLKRLKDMVGWRKITDFWFQIYQINRKTGFQITHRVDGNGSEPEQGRQSTNPLVGMAVCQELGMYEGQK